MLAPDAIVLPVVSALLAAVHALQLTAVGATTRLARMTVVGVTAIMTDAIIETVIVSRVARVP